MVNGWMALYTLLFALVLTLLEQDCMGERRQFRLPGGILGVFGLDLLKR